MTRVHIELQRVQTWLFAVPRLRAMVGANTLLGEVLRGNLPNLARQHSSWRLARRADGYPAAVANDPLSAYDDPASDAKDGILSRDGGHFEANFASGASQFASAAAELLRRELPDIRFRTRIDGVEHDPPGVGLSTELPVLSPCEWTGRGLGSDTIVQGTERAFVSLGVSRRHDAARRAEDGKATDLSSLLVAATVLKRMRAAETFQELAGSGYLAVIHADGNGVGSAAGSDDVERAVFFHRNRVLLRRALQTAIGKVCADPVPGGTEIAPLELLMLGGDDLLVVCRAETALPFVVALCEALAEFQRAEPSAFELTLGVGIVLARPTIPVHRLHEIAEQLAASAKRRFRGFSQGERRSVVDWAVYTGSWLGDPEDVRRRDWVRGKTGDLCVLSRRPVDVLGDGLDSLRGLLGAAERIKDAPRSQLRYLVDQLPRGRALSELAFAELSKEAQDGFREAGVEEVWTGSAGNPWLTSVLDLVEISEIRRLGRAEGPQANR